MKLKNKDTIYLVKRLAKPMEVDIAAFRTIDRADDYAGACQQKFTDVGIGEDQVTFKVYAVIYYDE